MGAFSEKIRLISIINYLMVLRFIHAGWSLALQTAVLTSRVGVSRFSNRKSKKNIKP